MLSDDLRARVNAHADREWPHVEDGDPDVNAARAVRRLTFRQGVEWAMAHTADEDLPISAERDRLRAGVEAALTYLDTEFERFRTDEDSDEPSTAWVPRDRLFDALCDVLEPGEPS